MKIKVYQLAVAVALMIVVGLMVASAAFGVGPLPAPAPSRAVYEEATLVFALPSKEFKPYYLPLFLAQEEEWFAERNLNIKIVYARGAQEAIEMVASGEANFAMVNAEEVILARANGLTVRTVMQIYKNNPYGIALAGAVPAAESLAGKRIGVPSDAPEFYVRSLLEQKGLQDNVELVKLDYRTRELGGLAEDLRVGKVDGVFTWATDVPLLKKEGLNVEFLPFSSYGLNFPSVALISSDRFIEEQEEVFLRTLNPIAKGLKWTVFSTSSAVKILAEFAPETYGSPGAAEDVAKTVGSLIMSGTEPRTDIWGVAPIEDYADFINFMAESGILATKLVAEDVTAVNDKIIEACTVAAAPSE